MANELRGGAHVRRRPLEQQLVVDLEHQPRLEPCLLHSLGSPATNAVTAVEPSPGPAREPRSGPLRSRRRSSLRQGRGRQLRRARAQFDGLVVAARYEPHNQALLADLRQAGARLVGAVMRAEDGNTALKVRQKVEAALVKAGDRL